MVQGEGAVGQLPGLKVSLGTAHMKARLEILFLTSRVNTLKPAQTNHSRVLYTRFASSRCKLELQWPKDHKRNGGVHIGTRRG